LTKNIKHRALTPQKMGEEITEKKGGTTIEKRKGGKGREVKENEQQKEGRASWKEKSFEVSKPKGKKKACKRVHLFPNGVGGIENGRGWQKKRQSLFMSQGEKRGGQGAAEEATRNRWLKGEEDE